MNAVKRTLKRIYHLDLTIMIFRQDDRQPVLDVVPPGHLMVHDLAVGNHKHPISPPYLPPTFLLMVKLPNHVSRLRYSKISALILFFFKKNKSTSFPVFFSEFFMRRGGNSQKF